MKKLKKVYLTDICEFWAVNILLTQIITLSASNSLGS